VNKSLLVCIVLGVFGVLGGPVGAALATGDVNQASCPNEAMEGFNAALPDCRAYEMVTPANKEGAQVEPAGSPASVRATIAADGSSLVGRSREAFAGLSSDEVLGGTDEFGFYRFSRTGSGWATVPLNPYRGAMDSIGVGDSVWGPSEIMSDPARLRLRAADGSVSEIGPVWPPAFGPNLEYVPFRLLGVAADARNGVVFGILDPKLLWPFDSTVGETSSRHKLTVYEYTGTDNAEPRLVGVTGGAGSTALVSQCGTVLGGPQGIEAEGLSLGYNAVSEDGSHVFFTALATGCAGAAPPANEVFARIDGSSTVAISEPTAADCPLCNTGVPANAEFQGASADGSKVFFTTTQALLGSDASENLYEYDFASPAGQAKVVRVSGGDGSVSVPAAEVVGVSRISEDGSHVYFVAHGVLTSAVNGGGEGALGGADNLYVFERDARYPAGRTVFIADLCSEAGLSGSVSDSRCPSSLTGGGSGLNDGSLWGKGPGVGDQNRPVQATPDGRFLVFTSYADLTAGDMSTARQVFQYDAQTGSLARVSVGSEGFNSDGNVTGVDSNRELDARIASQSYDGGQSRSGVFARTMSDDGSYVFFQSPVGLTPGALDRVQVAESEAGTQAYAQNVYEYHAGRVSLIGTDSAKSINRNSQVLIGTSASGGDVFFQSLDRLVGQDTDTLLDFYDARVAGGFPAPVTPAGCEGDGCQGAPGGSPMFAGLSTGTPSGGGNLAPPSVSKRVVGARGLTGAQKLSRALAACRREPKRRRVSCRARARRRYGRSHSASAGKSGRGGK
jgi:hypothetical protein